jgi:hypothetical protein
MRLITGHHGIREPAIRIPVLPWDVDAFILPGLAFDEQGGRLGYGAGHYDAILAKANKTAPKIALCYDWQVVEQPLPQDAHDMRMDWIVTDKRVINCVENRRAQVPINVNGQPSRNSADLIRSGAAQPPRTPSGHIRRTRFPS